MQTVLVSLISHSDPAGITDCLAALRDDGVCRRKDIAVTVLDNASRDGSVEAIHREHPGVRVIESGTRRGFGENHNTVIRATRSRYVLVLNDDVRVGRGMIDALVAFLDDHPAAAAAGPLVMSVDGTVCESAWRLPSWRVIAGFALTLGRNRATQSGGATARRVEQASACALLLRRSALESVGLFDESFFMYGEDTDLCKRLGDAGHEVWYVPAAAAVHLGGRSTSTVRAARITEEWRSRRRYWEKHHGAPAARFALVMRGLPYALGLLLVRVSPLLPRRLRRVVGRWRGDELWLQLRGAWRPGDEAGLLEVASDWNVRTRSAVSGPADTRPQSGSA